MANYDNLLEMEKHSENTPLRLDELIPIVKSLYKFAQNYLESHKMQELRGVKLLGCKVYIRVGYECDEIAVK
jgi:hypothetical protein